MIREVHLSPTARWVLRGVAATSVLLFLSVVFFVVRTERAFRESVCPFRPVASREVSGIGAVEEEARRCLPDVEERRWTLVRAGAGDPEAARRVLGTRRLATKFFAPGAYRWRVEAEGARGLALRIENDGIDPAVFFEKPPERPTRP